MAANPTPQAKRTKSVSASQTFLDHLHELRGRLFWVAASFIIFSAAAYPFAKPIIDILVAPLQGQSLVYLTPIGGFSFIIKICTYVGILISLPVVIYHLYRYLQPLMPVIRRRSVIGYITWSSLLAVTGVAFAYFISLPAALRFLTNFGIESVSAMLTVDAYLSFVITYILGAAILFQVPLVLLIIDSIKPLPPKGLMGAQRFVVLGSFVIAAIISPTPDIMNQLILALPMIGMYQVGIVLVWLRQKRRKHSSTKIKEQALEFITLPPLETTPRPISKPAVALQSDVIAKHRPIPRFIDGVAPAVPLETWRPESGLRQPRHAVISPPTPRVAPVLKRSRGSLISDVRRTPQIAT